MKRNNINIVVVMFHTRMTSISKNCTVTILKSLCYSSYFIQNDFVIVMYEKKHQNRSRVKYNKNDFDVILFIHDNNEIILNEIAKIT